MLVIEGMPLFLIEMGIGQRLRVGPVGVWNAIHPYLGGVGISSAVVSFLVALYYNVIIAWCLFYLFNSFGSSLPWEVSDSPSMRSLLSLRIAMFNFSIVPKLKTAPLLLNAKKVQKQIIFGRGKPLTPRSPLTTWVD